MSVDRFDDGAVDAALDREIRALLTIEPSPQFAASVRRQMANQPATPHHQARRLVAGATALAATVLLVAMLQRPAPAARPRGQMPPLAARGSVGFAPLLPSVSRPVRVDAAVLPGTSAPEAPGPPRTAHFSPPRPGPPSEPEVLIAQDEARALRALIAGVRDGRVELTPATQATTPDVMELEPIRNLVIAPIVITPVEGVRQ